jgi:transposase
MKNWKILRDCRQRGDGLHHAVQAVATMHSGVVGLLVVRRHELTDESWVVIEPLLAPPRMGRPVRDRRQVVNGILWKLSTGAAWRDLPERYGPWKTVYERFRRWSADGTWDRLLAHVQQHCDAVGAVDWTVVCVDSTTVRAHQRMPRASRRRGDAARRHADTL